VVAVPGTATTRVLAPRRPVTASPAAP